MKMGLMLEEPEITEEIVVREIADKGRVVPDEEGEEK